MICLSCHKEYEAGTSLSILCPQCRDENRKMFNIPKQIRDAEERAATEMCAIIIGDLVLSGRGEPDRGSDFYLGLWRKMKAGQVLV